MYYPSWSLCPAPLLYCIFKLAKIHGWLFFIQWKIAFFSTLFLKTDYLFGLPQMSTFVGSPGSVFSSSISTFLWISFRYSLCAPSRLLLGKEMLNQSINGRLKSVHTSYFDLPFKFSQLQTNFLCWAFLIGCWWDRCSAHLSSTSLVSWSKVSPWSAGIVVISASCWDRQLTIFYSERICHLSSLHKVDFEKKLFFDGQSTMKSMKGNIVYVNYGGSLSTSKTLIRDVWPSSWGH